jgi:hexokinase
MGNPDREIVILNDTVATLLAGKAATAGKEYDTYIGFILGTGTNTCYIESNRNITKTAGLDPNGSMIINIESGNFNKASRGDIDIAMDNQTKSPGTYAFEKMISGGYFGPVCTTAFKQAAAERLFSSKTIDAIDSMAELTSEDVNKYVCGIDLASNALEKILTTPEDKAFATEMVEGLIERASKLVAANIASVVLKTGKAKSADKPVLMTIEGTTFYKLKNFQSMFESYLQGFLSGENQRYYEIVEVENSSLVGAAIAAIVN